MERGLTRNQPSPGVSIVQSVGRRFSDKYLGPDLQNCLRNYRRPEVACCLAIPQPFQWLLTVVKFRMLLLRRPYGLMLFSSDKLRKQAIQFAFGMSHALDLFFKELAPAGASTIPDTRSMRSAQDAPP